MDAPTPMQQTVLNHLNEGHSVAAIADALGTSPSNIYGHIRRMKEKKIRVPKPTPGNVPPIAAGIKQPPEVKAVDVHESVGEVIASAIQKVTDRLGELAEHEAKQKASHAHVLEEIEAERAVLVQHLKQYQFADAKLAGTDVKGSSEKTAAKPADKKATAPRTTSPQTTPPLTGSGVTVS